MLDYTENVEIKLDEQKIEEIHLFWKHMISDSNVEWKNIKDDLESLKAIYALKEEFVAASPNTASSKKRYGRISKDGNWSVSIKIDLLDLLKFTFDLTDVCNEQDEVKKKAKGWSAAYSAIKAFIFPVFKGLRRLNNEEKCICLLICDFARKTSSDQVPILKIKELVSECDRNEGFYCPFANIKCEHIAIEEDEYFCNHFKHSQAENTDKKVDVIIDELCKGDNPVLVSKNGMITIPSAVSVK